jgi:hypothetical protein
MSARWRCATIALGLLGPWVLPAPVIAAPRRALLGTVASTVETAAFVSALDPASLRPVGPRVELGEYHDGWSFSPDGRLIAFGKSPAGRNTRDSIRIVDTAHVALVGTVLTPAYVGPLAWLAPRRLVGLVADQRPVVVDPLVPRIVGPRAPREAGTCGFPSAGVRVRGRRRVDHRPAQRSGRPHGAGDHRRRRGDPARAAAAMTRADRRGLGPDQPRPERPTDPSRDRHGSRPRMGAEGLRSPGWRRRARQPGCVPARSVEAPARPPGESDVEGQEKRASVVPAVIRWRAG